MKTINIICDDCWKETSFANPNSYKHYCFNCSMKDENNINLFNNKINNIWKKD